MSEMKEQKKRKGLWWKIPLGLFALLVVVSALTSSDDKKDSTAADSESSTTEVAQTKETPTTTEAEANKGTYKVGESYTGDTWKITVNGSRETATINEQNNQFLVAKADSGEKYVIVDVTFENITNKTQTYSSLLEQPKIKTPDGLELDSDFTAASALKNNFKDGQIIPAGKKRGEFAFKAGADLTHYSFFIEFFGEPLSWELK
jgi:hypothetical protein